MPTDTKPYNNLGDGTRTNLLFGEWLVERGLIGDEQLRAALAEQKRSGERLGWILVQQKCLTESQLTEALSAALSVEHLALDDLSVIDKEIARQVPENIAKRFGLIAIGRRGDKAIVAMTDPLNVVAVDTVSVKLKRAICTGSLPKALFGGRLSMSIRGRTWRCKSFGIWCRPKTIWRRLRPTLAKNRWRPIWTIPSGPTMRRCFVLWI